MAYTLTYTLNSDGNSYTLSGYSGDKPTGELVIPKSYDNKPVTIIGGRAFQNCSGLTSITIGNSVTSIGANAFYGCRGLTSVTIPNSVTSIGGSAFQNCSSLTTITIPDSVTSIGDSAFYNCTSLTTITIPNSVTSIGGSAFQNCSSLTNITIPDSVTSIGGSAFHNCSGLTSVTIGNSVTSIGGYAFSGCTSLTTITIPDSVTSIGNSAFSGCTGLTRVTIGIGVTSIGMGAFQSCSSLTNITIPDSVTSIGGSAFYNCSGLTSATIGIGVTSIGNSAFAACTNLTSITVSAGNSVYHSADNCIIKTATKTLIAGCNTSVIPDDGSVTSIGNSAFKGCSSLTNITIPNSVTSIGMGAFQNCSSLTTITIPDSVTSIGTNVFYYCTSLTTITIPNSVTSIGGSAFQNCSSLTNITIPDSVTSIGDYAFAGCIELTSITIPDSVTSIGGSAFQNCSGLTSIEVANGNTKYHSNGNCLIKMETKTLILGCKTSVIPADGSVTSIGYEAFRGCSGLTNITIPNSVTSIYNYAFYNCSSLTKVNMLPITPPTILNNTLDDTVQSIYVPAQCGETYKTATNWNAYADKIAEFPLLDLGSLILYNNKVKAKIDADSNKNEDTYTKQNGSYPNLTAGKANIHATELLANNADLNNYYGADYWGKNYYATGNNSIVNRPIENDPNGFSLEILRGGAGGTIQRCTLFAKGGSATQPVMFTRWHLGTAWKEWQETAEAIGTYPNMTVGKATNLTEPFVIGSDTNTAQTWVTKFATITLKAAWVSSATRFEIVDTNYTNNTTQPVGVEISASPTTTNLTVRAYALYGNPIILNNIYISHSAIGTFPMTVDLYYSIENTAYTTIGIKPLWQARRSTNSNVEFITTNTNVSALPTDRTNIRLTELANYAVITRAGYDGDGNNIASTYAKKAEISNPNLLINPDFSINQRGQKSYSGGAYGVDRWLISTGTTAEIQESGALKLKRTEAGNCCLQRIEDWKKLVGKTVTLSVKFSQITAGSVKCNLYTGTTFTGTPVSTSGSVSTVTVTIPTDATKVECFIYADSACEVVPEYAKLEIGSVATEFIPPLIAEELPKCQRYYEKTPVKSVVKYARSTGQFYDGYIPYKVTKRTQPTVKLYSNDGTVDMLYGSSEATNIQASTGWQTTYGFLALSSTNALTVGSCYEGYFEADAEIY